MLTLRYKPGPSQTRLTYVVKVDQHAKIDSGD